MRTQRIAAITIVLTAWSLPSQGQVLDRIAFQSSRDADLELPATAWEWEIYSMNRDGSDQVNLTNRFGQDIDPAWSPDGTQIAFASNRTGTFQIFVMDADGSNQVQLTQQPGDHVWPAWSPDGSQIAYASDEEGDYDLYVMAADGSDAVNITQLPGQDYAPSWSSDGARLAFSSDRDRILSLPSILDPFLKLWVEPSDIFVMDALGGSATNLTFIAEAETNSLPAWSPIDGRIAYISRGSPTGDGSRPEDIVVLSAGGGGGVRLDLPQYELFYNLRSVSWSRDASRLSFSSSGEGMGWQIHTVPAGGGRPLRLTASPGHNLHATWSPMSKTTESTSVAQASWGVVKGLFMDDEDPETSAD